jgi:hypothetical protein
MTAAARPSAEPLKRTSVFLYQWQVDGLNDVNARTDIPVASLIRRGVERILAEHGIKPPARTTKGRGRR